METTCPNILFDDRVLLETALGQDALQVSSANANCDCVSHSSPFDDEDVSAYQVAPVAG